MCACHETFYLRIFSFLFSSLFPHIFFFFHLVLKLSSFRNIIVFPGVMLLGVDLHKDSCRESLVTGFLHTMCILLLRYIIVILFRYVPRLLPILRECARMYVCTYGPCSIITCPFCCRCSRIRPYASYPVRPSLADPFHTCTLFVYCLFFRLSWFLVYLRG